MQFLKPKLPALLCSLLPPAIATLQPSVMPNSFPCKNIPYFLYV
jgi:hypothetical protein